MKVEVCHADAKGATRIEVDVHDDATLGDALRDSGIVERLRLDPAGLAFAIFGRRARLDTSLEPGDRIELLRPLIVDPKEARRRRVAKNGGASGGR